jgi:hypothetical protein
MAVHRDQPIERMPRRLPPRFVDDADAVFLPLARR